VEADFDDFGVSGLHGAADVLGFNGHFAMAAIDEDAKGHALGTAQVEEAVHGGTDGAAGVKDIVDEDQVHGIHGESYVGRLEDSLWSDFGEVIAIKRDIECADGNFNAIDATHGLSDTFGQRYTATTDADESEILCAAALLDNLVSEALQRAVDFRGGHKLTFFDDAHGRVILAQVSRGIETVGA
jgi:hypothetical protein